MKLIIFILIVLIIAALDVINNYVACLLLNRGKEAVMVANINLIKQESYSVVNLEKQLSRTVTNKIITMSK